MYKVSLIPITAQFQAIPAWKKIIINISICVGCWYGRGNKCEASTAAGKRVIRDSHHRVCYVGESSWQIVVNYHISVAFRQLPHNYTHFYSEITLTIWWPNDIYLNIIRIFDVRSNTKNRKKRESSCWPSGLWNLMCISLSSQ